MRVQFFALTIALGTSALFLNNAGWSQAHGNGGTGGHAMAPAAHMGSAARSTGPGRAPVASFPGGSAARTGSRNSTGVRSNYSAQPGNQSNGYGGNWTSAGFIAHGSPSGNSYGHSGRDRHVGYGYGLGYPFIPYGDGYSDSGLGYSDDSSQQPVQASSYADNTPPYMAQGDQGYQSYGPAAYAQDTARMQYNSGSATSAGSNASASDGLGHPKVTLIFKDGRSPMKIQNYAMSQTRIFVRDNDTDRDIALSDLDVPATMAANDQAGVDFELPVKR